MALEQRQMVSPPIREHEIPVTPGKQPRKHSRKKHSRKLFSAGEKLLFVLFTTILVLFTSMIIYTEGQLNDVNREVQLLDNKIEEIGKKNIELSIQAQEKSTYERVWEKAKELGLDLNGKNVKVVPRQ